MASMDSGITGVGVALSDICEMDPIPGDQESTFLDYLANCLCNNPDNRITPLQAERGVLVSSLITVSQEPWFSRSRSIQKMQHLSICHGHNMNTPTQRLELGVITLLPGFIEPTEYLQGFKQKHFIKYQLEYLLTSMLKLKTKEVCILKDVAAALLTTTAFGTNHYIYFKLFCNVFARARLEWAPDLPVINDQNSGLKYVVAGQEDVADYFTADNLKTWAMQQYFAFFSPRSASAGFITLWKYLNTKECILFLM